MEWNTPSQYNTFNAQHVDEGRRPKFGEPTFVSSVRLPVSSREDYNSNRGTIARDVLDILNKKK
ncbi:hypothetical protein V0242_18595 [Aeromonas hydrophila]|uniref:hypothetical protein n=1 Tax=Aeromonas hydrophila TaxID=644 RepID=UPI002ED649B5|nr:hypothetical protein V0242_18595 [Aeromonas hydrophila]